MHCVLYLGGEIHDVQLIHGALLNIITSKQYCLGCIHCSKGESRTRRGDISDCRKIDPDLCKRSSCVNPTLVTVRYC